MVTITVTNQDEHSEPQTVVIDLGQKTCVINNSQTIPLSQFLQSGFNHYLLTFKPLELEQGVYQYVYHDSDSMLVAPLYVYATLIQAQDPKSCHFRIRPDKHAHVLKSMYHFNISQDANTLAQEKINVLQLNKIVTELTQTPFQYQDSIAIDQEFSYNDLPESVNGDELCLTFPEKEEYLSKSEELSKLDLRYINNTVGFGLFARETIKKDELVSVYCGQKIVNKRKPQSNYYFSPHGDCFDMGVDAKFYGNISRFINHAPKPGTQENATNLLEANIEVMDYRLYGMNVLCFIANRDIAKNEQLLFDYGLTMFPNVIPLRFNSKQQVLDKQQRIIKDSFSNKVPMLRALLHSGVKSAFLPLYRRLIIGLIVSAVLLALVRWW